MSRYVSSDWHGNYKLAKKVLEFLKEDDELYFLGDAIDRGPQGIHIMYELLKDKRIIYLKGNHEDMMAICISEFIEGHFHNAPWWYRNGGEVTWKTLEPMSDEIKAWFYYQIEKMPERIDLTREDGKKIILTHAGCTPWITDEECRLMGVKDRYIWDRKHIHHSWDEFKEEEWKDTYVIHGHTPVLSSDFCGDPDIVLPEFKEVQAVSYADGHKICIDMCTIITNRICLLDLDTFEEIYFDLEEEGKE